MKILKQSLFSFYSLLCLSVFVSLPFTAIQCQESETVPEAPSTPKEVVIPTDDSTGVVKSETIFSANLNRNLKYKIYLPISYEYDTTLTYEVFYLLHGYGGSELDWVAQGLVDKTINTATYHKQMREIIVVMPDGDNEWYVDRTVKMESAMIKELIPQIEAKYRIKQGRLNRSIGGLSMGGYGSMRFVLRYPEMFYNVVLMSPAAYYPSPDEGSVARYSTPFLTNGVYDDAVYKSLNYPNYWSIFDASTVSPYHFYVSVGDTEPFVGIKEASATEIPQALAQRNGKVILKTATYSGGHEWKVWKVAVKDALLDMYKK